MAFLTVNQTSFISNLISLDQENFLFIRSLPISMNQYLKEKLRFGWILQSLLTGGIALLSGLSFQLPLFFPVTFTYIDEFNHFCTPFVCYYFLLYPSLLVE
ncbi:hypothetical protein AS262_11850 [Enterococcus faecium]|nr:hypothetical protein AS262_11850 [Enterococcus faecium]